MFIFQLNFYFLSFGFKKIHLWLFSIANCFILRFFLFPLFFFNLWLRFYFIFWFWFTFSFFLRLWFHFSFIFRFRFGFWLCQSWRFWLGFFLWLRPRLWFLFLIRFFSFWCDTVPIFTFSIFANKLDKKNDNFIK